MSKMLTKRELTRKRAWYRALNGFMDFFGSIASFIIILLCVALLVTLIGWFRTDAQTTFQSVESVVINSIVNPDTE
ncbi:MAG: hypothetical protein Q4D04_06435 [Clostridia bacterium]|nr:hypothetical protein [Clostridia bacterium]